MKLSERWRELRRIWNSERRPVVQTAVGWCPGEDWTEQTGPTPSGNREYYTVVRVGGEPSSVKFSELNIVRQVTHETNL
jgi:hypothetical protein